jgi:predicted TIM-barrel fold metal-dependent hydrolase
MVLAVEELERVAARGARAVMIRPNTCLGINIDHPNFEAFWAAAQDLDVAIGIHEGFNQGSFALPRLGEDRTHNWLQLHAFEHPVEHMMAVMLLTTGGVMHRYPKLRFGFLENGAGWAGFWLHHLDEHYEKLYRFYPELPPEEPSFYFKRQCFLGVEPDYAHIPHLIDCGLEDTLVFSSDFPHYDAVFPGSVAACANREDLTQTSKRKILRDNALRFYGVDK